MVGRCSSFEPTSRESYVKQLQIAIDLISKSLTQVAVIDTEGKIGIFGEKSTSEESWTFSDQR